MYKIKWKVYTHVFKVREFIYEVIVVIFQVIIILNAPLVSFMTFIHTRKQGKKP